MADESAILIAVPESERLVGSYRLRYDPVAKAGVPAHITLLYPFRDPKAITSRNATEIQQVLDSFKAFDFRLGEIREFSGAIYLHPEPDDIFREMTHALVAQFPDCPPYGGAYSSVTPHLTVAQGEPAALEIVGKSFREDAESYLPIESWAREIWLMTQHNGTWTKKTSFALRQ